MALFAQQRLGDEFARGMGCENQWKRTERKDPTSSCRTVNVRFVGESGGLTARRWRRSRHIKTTILSDFQSHCLTASRIS